ncbi:MAG TPA: CvpA family protein [Dehalococcoidia bacterium]|nr:CvpA family protein [Dehalococcoidia bacterium]
MNWLDVVIVIALLGFTVAAFRAGLIREVVTLSAVIIGIVIAGFLYDALAVDIFVFIDNQNAAEAVSFLMLFGSVYLFGQIAAYMLKTGASLLMLGPWDHLGGAIFGFIKGIFIVQILLIVFAAYPSLGLDGAVENSALAQYFIDDFSFLLKILPRDFEDRIDDFLGPDDDPSVYRLLLPPFKSL